MATPLPAAASAAAMLCLAGKSGTAGFNPLGCGFLL